MSKPDWLKICLDARDLDPDEGAALDAVIAADPEDLDARVKRIGFASRTGLALGEDVAWLVWHHPEVDVGGFATVDPAFDAESHASVASAWDAHVRRTPHDPKVLRGAARFFDHHLPERAEELLQRGAMLEPRSSLWSDLLARSYMARARDAKDDAARVALAAGAVRSLEQALSLEDHPGGRIHLLCDLADAALLALHTPRARAVASELLAACEGCPGTDAAGDGTHRAHVVLGKLALAEDDVRAAVNELMASTGTTGSPVLGSFGPDLDLARELIGLGERAAVEAYLVGCRTFWRSGAADIDRWLEQLRSGSPCRLAPDWDEDDDDADDSPPAGSSG